MKKIFLGLFICIMLISFASAINIDQFSDSTINTSIWEVQNGTGDTISENTDSVQISVLGGVGSYRWSNLTTLSSFDIFQRYDGNVSYRVWSLTASAGGGNRQRLQLIDGNGESNLTLIEWSVTTLTDQIGNFYKDGSDIKYSFNGGAESSFDISSWGNVRFRMQTVVSPSTSNFQISLDWINASTGLPSISVNLNSPSNSSTTSSKTVTFNASISPSSISVVNTTLYLWNSTSDLINETTQIITGTSTNETLWTVGGIALGDYTWNVRGCGSADLCAFETSNFTFTKGGSFDQFGETDPVLETTTSEFSANVSVGSGVSIQTAILSYNGTNYTVTSKTELVDGNFTLVKSITIPGGTQGFNSEVRPYYWAITLVNEATGRTYTQQSAEQSQTVSELTFALCNPNMIYSVLNFTMFDETTGTEINGSINATTFEATFSLGTTADNLVKNYSISNVSVSDSRFNFCTNASGSTIYANMEAEYTASGYTDKNYYLTGATLTTTENEISLFLLPTGDAIQFFLEVIRGLTGLPDVTVTIAKYFVGEGAYKTIEIDRTDDAGEFTSYLELDKKYRFTITDGADVLGIVDKVASCEAAPCGITLNLGSASVNPFSFFDAAFASNVVYNLSFNPVNKVVTFDFVDTTGLSTYFRLEILRSMHNQTDISIYDNTVYSSSGSITFNMTGYPDGDYRVNTYISRSPESFIDFINFILSEASETLGMTGLVIAFIIVLVVVFSLAMTPSFLILAVPLSLMFVRVIGIAYIDTTMLMGVWLLAILLVALMRK